MRKFAIGLFAGCFGLLGGLAAAYAALAFLLPASFPAPPLTRLAALDEKLRFLRENPEIDPRILAVGSSITWRQLAGSSFERAAGGRKHFLNGATVSLQIHQTADLLDFYLDNYPHVRTVLIMAGLPDFTNCSTEPRALLDHKAARAYAFEGWPAAWFYLRYFSPQRFARTALTLAERQTPLLGDLYLDAYGSGPLQVPDESKRGLRYHAMEPDPACVSALIGISESLSNRGISLVLVFPPVHPDYREAYPGAVYATCQIARDVELATRRHKTELLVLPRDAAFADEDFFDAFHLQFTAVQRLSSLVASRIEQSLTSAGKLQASGEDLARGLRRSCAVNEARTL